PAPAHAPNRRDIPRSDPRLLGRGTCARHWGRRYRVAARTLAATSLVDVTGWPVACTDDARGPHVALGTLWVFVDTAGAAAMVVRAGLSAAGADRAAAASSDRPLSGVARAVERDSVATNRSHAIERRSAN